MSKKNVGYIGGVIVGLIIVVSLIYVFMCGKFIDTGYVGVVYSYNGGVTGEVLTQGFKLVSPTKKVKQFTISNEQLLLTKDKREGSEEDESFKVSTADDASIAISFQMSYRFIEGDVVDTFKKFKGMDGEAIVNQRIRTVLKSKVSEITTNYSMMDIYSGNRSEINNKLTEYLNDAFNTSYGIEVLDASIIDVHPDEKLKDAIDARVTALQKKQQAQAEQETAKVEAQTALIKAQSDADIKVTKAKADADSTKIKAEAEAESNKKIAESITRELIDYKEAEARMEHGWITVTGADTVVSKEK